MCENNSSNNVIITEEVIYKMVRVAATEVAGVDSVGTYTKNLTSMVKLDRPFDPISIYKNDNTMAIDVSIVVKPGYLITDVAKAVQKNVKETIQNMAGIVVTGVNVSIIDIKLEPNKAE